MALSNYIPVDRESNRLYQLNSTLDSLDTLSEDRYIFERFKKNNKNFGPNQATPVRFNGRHVVPIRRIL